MPLGFTLRDANVISLGRALASMLLKAPQVILNEQARFRMTGLDGTLSGEPGACSWCWGTSRREAFSGSAEIWEVMDLGGILS